MLKVNKISLIIIAVFATTFPTITFAGATDDITQLTSEIAVLEAKLKHVTVEAEIAKKETEIRLLSLPPAAVAPTNTQMNLSSPIPSPSSNYGHDSDIYVSGIEGYDGDMTALISYGQGEPFQARVKDILDDGWAVYLIEPSAVTLVKEVPVAFNKKNKNAKKFRLEKKRIAFGQSSLITSHPLSLNNPAMPY